MNPHNAGPRGLRCVVLGALFGGCTLQQPPLALDPAKDVPTTLDTVTVACDVDNARWDIEAQTTGWSGGGEVLMSRDGAYLEVHRLPSVEALGDGSADRLELRLSVLADWRDVSPGSSTLFNCAEPGLAGMVRVFTRDGASLAGCAAFGVDPAIWQTWRTEYTCDVVIELEREPDDSGDTATSDPG